MLKELIILTGCFYHTVQLIDLPDAGNMNKSFSRNIFIRFLFPVAVFLYLFLACYYYGYFIQDDTYIFLRYARNFAEGYGLVFNVGEYVEGFTSLLWTLLLVPCFLIDIDYFIYIKLLTTACGIATVGVFLLLVHNILTSRFAILTAVLLFLTNHRFLIWSQSGLETTLYVLFVCAFTLFLFRLIDCDWLDAGKLTEMKKFTRYMLLFLILAQLTRPETPMIFLIGALILLYKSWISDHNYSSFLTFVADFLLFYSVITGIRFFIYGLWAPNTYYAKIVHEFSQVVLGWEKWRFMMLDNVVNLTVMLSGILGFLLFSRRKLKHWYIVFILLAFSLYYIRIGSDVMLEQRLFLPAFSFLYLLFASSLENLTSLVTKKIRQHHRSFQYIYFVAVFLLVFFLTYKQCENISRTSPYYYNVLDALERCHIEAGKILQLDHKPGDKLVLLDAGATSFFAKDMYVADFYGLTDKTIAHIFYRTGFNNMVYDLTDAYNSPQGEKILQQCFQQVTRYFNKLNPEYVAVTLKVLPLDVIHFTKYVQQKPENLDEWMVSFMNPPLKGVFMDRTIAARYKPYFVRMYSSVYYLLVLIRRDSEKSVHS